MSSPPPQPHPVPRATVASAVGALTKWMKKRADAAPPNLLADERDDLMLLQLSLRRVPASPTTRPRLLPLPHPVITHSGSSVCVISDDRPKSRSLPASDLLDAAKTLGFPISEVIPLSTLRTDYRPYESRRRLAGSHDLFIADRAILPLLPRVLGKAFYSTKKAPIGVDFTRVGWPEQVRKVLGSSFLYLRTGTCSGIKVGRLDMEEEEIVENVIAAVEAAVEKVPKKWANVRALHLKAVDSVALPIYQAVPELGMKIEVPSIPQLEGEVVSKEESGKRKWNKKKRTEDVVMQEDVQEEPEKKKRKVPSDKGQKGEHSLEKEAKSGKDSKKGKKSESAMEEVGSMKKKGKKDMLDVANTKNKKGKSEEGRKKKSIKGADDSVESVEDKKRKGKKLDGDKIKKTRIRVRV
ncbi:hypothetical protein EJB05_54034, partial [Eragrostis curvula]